jgi:hypothetical protein
LIDFQLRFSYSQPKRSLIDRDVPDHGKENPMTWKRKALHFFPVAAALGLTLAAGCATSSILSSQKISQGDRAISDAQLINASVSAPDELKSAEEKLAQAKEAQAKKDYELATRLAEQASVDADYARARATSDNSQKAVDEMREKNKVLREEVERLSKQ